MHDALKWLAIVFCLSQSALLSGLNLAVFSVSRLRLEAHAKAGDAAAARVLVFRRDANWTLATILWGNVAVNVALTLLLDSTLPAVAAFFVSTIAITFLGEIWPQAYFARNALRVASLLSPVLSLWRYLLYPVAKPVGRMLDWVVGPESIPWFREAELSAVLEHHATAAEQGEVGPLEATGAINFLALDDLPVRDEGQPIHPDSVLSFEFREGRPVFPEIRRDPSDMFLRSVAASGMKWVVLLDAAGEPRGIINAHELIRHALFEPGEFAPQRYCHYPLVTHDPDKPLGRVLGQLTVRPTHPGDDVIDQDLILLWTASNRRIITGSDLLGRLLRGIARRTASAPPVVPARA